MTITFPLTFPTVIRPAKTTWHMQTADGLAESPLSFAQQVYLNTGARWSVDVTMPKMRRVKAEQFIAFMAALKGRYGTFLLGDYDGRAPQGIATGTPLVNGGSQAGFALATKGWTTSKTGILKAGDYLQLGSGVSARMYKNLTDANSDGSGDATLDIWPPLRSSPADGASITLANAMTQMRLAAAFSWDADEVSTYSVVFSAVEALP